MLRAMGYIFCTSCVGVIAPQTPRFAPRLARSNSLHLLLGGIFLLLLSACASQPEYPMPQGFPEADTSKPCPNLEGAYRNLGAQQNNKGAFLSNVLEPFNAAFENTDDRALAYRRVALMNAIYADFTTQQSGALDVTLKAVDRDLILHPMPSSGQELTCKQGWLILTTKNSAIPFGLSKNTLAFAHARDGGLLVKNQKVDVISESLQAGQIRAEKALGWYYFPLHVAEEITPRW